MRIDTFHAQCICESNILMRKLEAMNIPDPILRWLESFLSGRKQRVKIGNIMPAWLDIWGTVPQGTFLGILLFICMINDLKTIVALQNM